MEAQQLPPGVEEQLKTGGWSHGLFGCFDNLGICIVTYFVPCVTFGQTHALMNNGTGCVTYACLSMIPFVNCYIYPKQRGEVRDLRGIPGGFCGDLALICCCSLCTVVQEAQEVQEYTTQKAALTGQALPVGGAVVVTHTTVPVGYVTAPADQQMHPPPGQQYAGQPYPGQPYPPQQQMTPQYAEKGHDMVKE